MGFIALLNYMNHFESVKQIYDEGLGLQGEFFNSFSCKQLDDYFDRLRNKLPIEPIPDTKTNFFLNNRGTKVFFDIENQPFLVINEGSQTVTVLSVGMSNAALPLITVLKDEKPVSCIRLVPSVIPFTNYLLQLLVKSQLAFIHLKPSGS